MDKTIPLFIETFQENRLKTEFVSSLESCSFIVYKFRIEAAGRTG